MLAPYESEQGSKNSTKGDIVRL